MERRKFCFLGVCSFLIRKNFTCWSSYLNRWFLVFLDLLIFPRNLFQVQTPTVPSGLGCSGTGTGGFSAAPGGVLAKLRGESGSSALLPVFESIISEEIPFLGASSRLGSKACHSLSPRSSVLLTPCLALPFQLSHSLPRRGSL